MNIPYPQHWQRAVFFILNLILKNMGFWRPLSVPSFIYWDTKLIKLNHSLTNIFLFLFHSEIMMYEDNTYGVDKDKL